MLHRVRRVTPRLPSILALGLIATAGVQCSSAQTPTTAPYSPSPSPTASTPTPPPVPDAAPPTLPIYPYYYLSWFFFAGTGSTCNSLYGVPKGGGAPASVYQLGLCEVVETFAFDATHAYASSASGLRAFPLSSYAGPVSLATDPDIPTITSDGTNVYFAVHDPSGDQIKTVPVAGGATQKLFDVPGAVASITVTAGVLYWTEGDGGYSDAGVMTGSLKRVPLAGGSPEVLASGLESPGPLVVDATGAYWIDRGALALVGSTFYPPWHNGSLKHLAPGSTTPVTLATNITATGSHVLVTPTLARAANAVYWAQASSSLQSEIRKLPDGSSQSQSLVSGLTAANNLFADGATLYYTFEEYASDPNQGVLETTTVGASVGD